MRPTGGNSELGVVGNRKRMPLFSVAQARGKIGRKPLLDEQEGISEALLPEPIFKKAEAAEYRSGVDCTEEEEYDRLHGLERWDPDWSWEIYEPSGPAWIWPFTHWRTRARTARSAS